MATEVFNLSGYVFESAAFNADFSVFNQNVSPYIVESPLVSASAAVFAQNVGAYLLNTGVPDANSVAVVNTRLYRVEGQTKNAAPGPTVNEVHVYELSGGRDLFPAIIVPDTIMYMITD